MGLGIAAVKYLSVMKKKYKIDFRKSVMLGRQELLFGADAISQQDLSEYLNVKDIVDENSIYSEKLFKYLGAETVDSVDNSDFEEATIILDLNSPIPDSLKEQFSVVVDGGTLEHVFNYPQSMLNAMNMVYRGGVLMLITPCNNYLGHGLYQFTPNMFWSILTPNNGFEILDMTLEESPNRRDSTFRKLEFDPFLPRDAEMSISKFPTQLFITARRIGDIPESLVVQQDYYEIAWSNKNLSEDINKDDKKEKSFSYLRASIKKVRFIRKVYGTLIRKINYKKMDRKKKKQKYDIDREWSLLQ